MKVGLRLLSGLVLAGLVSLPVLAQPGRISLEPVVEADGAHAGTTVRVVVHAQLDPGFHVNSNKPLEEFLIATALSLDPPDGIDLAGLAWPEPIMLNQTGADQPLAVFEEEFVIGATLSLAPELATGTYLVPGALRYQACDEAMCYLPATADLEFQVNVVPPSQEVNLSHTELFAGLAFDAVAGNLAGVDPGRPRRLSTNADADALAQLGGFTVVGTTGGYLDTDQFLEFVSRAESGRAAEGWFEGRGPFAILALVLFGGLALNLTPCVLPLIPINLAIIGAGTRAGSRRRASRWEAPTGWRWPSSMACLD